MVNVNDFLKQGDNEAFDAAIAARGADGIVVIPPRESTDGRDYWLLDRAILLPENTTVILYNIYIIYYECERCDILANTCFVRLTW